MSLLLALTSSSTPDVTLSLSGVLSSIYQGTITQTGADVGTTISAVNKTTGSDAVGGTSFTTSSITLAANKLGLLTVTSRTNISVTPNTPTISGWTLINAIEFDTGATSQKKISTFRRASTSSNTGTHTIDFAGQSQTHCDWVIDEITNTDLSSISGGGATNCTYIGTAAETTNADPVFTFASANIGTASATRRVICVQTKGRPSDRALSSATIGGISATIHADYTDSGGSNSSVAIFSAVVPTGTTATIVTTYDSTNFNGSNDLRIYTVDDSTISAITTSATAEASGTTSLATNYTSVADGFVIGATHFNNASGKSTQNPVGYTPDDIQSGMAHFHRQETTSGSQTETTIWTGAFDAATAIVVFSPVLGDNGATSIVQSVTAKDETLATGFLAVNLSAFGSTSNATYGAFGHGGSVATNTVQSGWTSLGLDVGYHKIATIFRSNNDTVVDMGSNAFDQHGGIAFELKAASGGGSPDISTSLSGISVLISSGSFNKALDKVLSGQSSTGSIGIISKIIDKALSGQSNTTGQGNIDNTFDKSLSGQNNTVQQGSTTSIFDKALSGQSNTVQQGNTTTTFAKALSGQSSTIQQGSITTIFDKVLVGQVSTFGIGSLTTSITTGDISLGLLGIQFNVNTGTFSKTFDKSLSGQSNTVQQGNVDNTFDKSLSGQSNTTNQGSLNKTFDKSLSGQSNTTNQGSLNKTFDKSLSGQSITIQHGSITTIFSKVLVGQSVAFNLGNIGSTGGDVLGLISASSSGFNTTAVNLTTLGTIDWAMWNDTNFDWLADNKKSGGGSLIGNPTSLRAMDQGSDTTTRSVTWIDGTPTASGSNSGAGLFGYSDGVNFWSFAGDGYKITVPADTTMRRASIIYSLLGNGDSFTFRAYLSDGSFTTQTIVTSTLATSTKSAIVITVDYKAASAGQTLYVEGYITADGDNNGYAALQAVTLSYIPAVTLALSGIQFNLSTGTFSKVIDKPLSGQSNTVQQGSLGKTFDKSISGQSNTTNQGSLNKTFDKVITGISSTTQQGNTSSNISIQPTGQVSTISQGTLKSDLSKAISGLISTIGQGNLLHNFDKSLLGQAIASSLGTIGAGSDITKALTGQQASFNTGQFNTSIAKALTGLVNTLSQGTILGIKDILVGLVGQALTNSIGSFGKNIDIGTTGISVTAFQNLVSAATVRNITGVSSAISQGSLQYSLSMVPNGIQINLVNGNLGSNTNITVTGINTTVLQGNLYLLSQILEILNVIFVQQSDNVTTVQQVTEDILVQPIDADLLYQDVNTDILINFEKEDIIITDNNIGEINV